MIRKPIGDRRRLALGLLGILAVVVGYTLFSSIYQAWINPGDKIVLGWGQILEGVGKILEPRTSGGGWAAADDTTPGWRLYLWHVVHRGSEIAMQDPATAAWRAFLWPLCGILASLGDSWLATDALATGWRLFLGLFYGILASVLLGIHMGCFPRFEAVLYPQLTFLAKIPPTAAIGVFVIMAGLELEMYVAMIAFGIVPTMTLGIYLSVRAFPDELLYKAYTLGASHTEVVWSLIFRFVLPKVLENVRLMIGPAMVYLIAAEFALADEGFGYRIRFMKKVIGMDVIYCYLVLLALFGFSVDYALRMLERRLCPWHARK